MIKSVLEKLVHVAKVAMEADDAMRKLGYSHNPYFDLYGKTADAIYIMVQEHTESFDQSATHKLLNTKSLSVDACVSALLEERKRNIFEMELNADGQSA